MLSTEKIRKEVDRIEQGITDIALKGTAMIPREVDLPRLEALARELFDISGGRNELRFNKKGQPSIMVNFPCDEKARLDYLSGSGSYFTVPSYGSGVPHRNIHPAFIVNGSPIKGFRLGKYKDVRVGSTNYHLSLYGLPPAYGSGGVTESYDGLASACDNLNAATDFSEGDRVANITYAIFRYLAMLSVTEGFHMRGADSYGKAHNATGEKGAPCGYNYNGQFIHVINGSGPNSWRHDGTPFGVYGLIGCTREICHGFELDAGKILLIPNNNALRATAAELANTSASFKAIATDGSLVDRTTEEGVFYYDYNEDPGSSGSKSFKLTTSLTHQQENSNPYGSMSLSSIPVEDGITVPMIMRLMGFYKLETGTPRGVVYMRNDAGRKTCAWAGSFWFMSLVAGSPISMQVTIHSDMLITMVLGASLQKWRNGKMEKSSKAAIY